MRFRKQIRNMARRYHVEYNAGAFEVIETINGNRIGTVRREATRVAAERYAADRNQIESGFPGVSAAAYA